MAISFITFSVFILFCYTVLQTKEVFAMEKMHLIKFSLSLLLFLFFSFCLLLKEHIYSHSGKYKMQYCAINPFTVMKTKKRKAEKGAIHFSHFTIWMYTNFI